MVSRYLYTVMPDGIRAVCALPLGNGDLLWSKSCKKVRKKHHPPNPYQNISLLRPPQAFLCAAFSSPAVSLALGRFSLCLGLMRRLPFGSWRDCCSGPNSSAGLSRQKRAALIKRFTPLLLNSPDAISAERTFRLYQ